MILECGRRAIHVACIVQTLMPSCCERDEVDGERKDKMFSLSLSPHPSPILPGENLAFPCRELRLYDTLHANAFIAAVFLLPF